MKRAVIRHVVVFSGGLGWLGLDPLTRAAGTAGPAGGRGCSGLAGCFNIVHVLNRGAAFGFLGGQESGWQFWLFLAAALLVAGVIVHIVRTSAWSPVLFFGLGSILGGAVGNLVDRVRSRAVTDFLDVYWGSWHWPAFNVADIAICLGVFLAGIVLLRQGREDDGRK